MPNLMFDSKDTHLIVRKADGVEVRINVKTPADVRTVYRNLRLGERIVAGIYPPVGKEDMDILLI